MNHSDIEVYLQHGVSYDPYQPKATERVEHKITDVPRHSTASGYGSRLPTPYMVRVNNRWRRVYARCWSNVASYYIGRGDSEIPVTIYN